MKSKSSGKKSQEKKPLSPEKKAALKEFRHNISILKKKGLVSSRVDARSVKPSSALKKRITEFQDVIRGEAKVWKVSKRKAFNDLVGNGERGANGHIVLPKSEFLHKDSPAYKEEGVTMKRTPMVKQTLDKHLRDMAKEMPLGPGQVYSFTIEGNAGLKFFYSVDEVIRLLNGYGQVGFYRQRLTKRDAEGELIKRINLTVKNEEGFFEERGPRVPGPHGRKFREVFHDPELERKAAKKRGRVSPRSRIRGK
jgi:hypothetical protein